MGFLILLLTQTIALGSPTSFFSDLCKSKDYSITNPQLPEVLGERVSCSVKVSTDGTFKDFPMRVVVEPCDRMNHSIPLGYFESEAVTQCGHDVYKLRHTPFKEEKGSIVYFSTTSDEADPSYMVAAFCKRGKLTGIYGEFLESLSDKELKDVRNHYGIKITAEQIDECLEKAGACA